MNARSTLIYLFILFMFLSCDYYDMRLKIQNKSSENIYLKITADTIFSLEGYDSFMIYGYDVQKDSIRQIMGVGSTKAWEFEIERSVDNKLHIFVLSEDTLKKYDPKEIVAQQKFKTRIDVGLEELKLSDWTVVVRD